MIDRPLAAGKLPVTLLRDLLSGDTPPPPELLLPPAIGEDAAVIQVSSGALIVAADPVTLTGSDVGAHAVMVNANDVAVMGARPRWFLCTVLLPLGTTEADVRGLFHGLRVALDSVGAVLVGGHTEVTATVTQPVVAGQMLGLREDGHFVRSSGMQEGDVVLQVGSAPIEGAAVLAREARERLVDVDTGIIERAKDALRSPGISVVNPSLRATELGASALHDPTEGGLSAGLFELADASQVALSVSVEAVLWFEPAAVICKALGADPWGVLASGTLLAAFPKRHAHQAQAALEADGYAVAAIAQAETGSGVRRQDGLEFRRYERDELSRILIA